MDFRVSAAMMRYNYSKFLTCMKENKLRQLEIEYDDVLIERSQNEAELRTNSAQNQKIRDLENRVHKLDLKGNECEFIQKSYDAIFRRLYDEHVRSNQTLDEMEADIIRCRVENAKLKETHKMAMNLRDEVVNDLNQLEKFELADRKRRDIEATRMRRVLNEEKLSAMDPSERFKSVS